MGCALRQKSPGSGVWYILAAKQGRRRKLMIKGQYVRYLAKSKTIGI